MLRVKITSLVLSQAYNCSSASEASLKNMGKYVKWITRNDSLSGLVQDCGYTIANALELTLILQYNAIKTDHTSSMCLYSRVPL